MLDPYSPVIHQSIYNLLQLGHPVGLQFAAIDDLIIQVQSHCNYDALSDPG